MKNPLISSFFKSPQEYIEFLTEKERLAIADEENKSMADLHKTTHKFWLYTLTWLPDGKYINEFIKPFRATAENIELFNSGCKKLAELLDVYIETNDISSLPPLHNPFGELTYKFPICPQPQEWNRIYKLISDTAKDNNSLPPKPLILDGWHYSTDQEKADRWIDTVYWIIENYPKPKILDDIEDYYQARK